MGKYRSQRTKKRVFKGNQHVATKGVSHSVAKLPTPNLTASSSKLSSSSKVQDSYPLNDLKFTESGFRFIDIEILSNIFACLACPECLGLGLQLTEGVHEGLSSALTLTCNACEFTRTFCTSNKVQKTSEINLRLVYAMRQLGQGHRGAKKLCTFLNCPPPLNISAYNRASKKISEVVKKISLKSMMNAADEIKVKSNAISNDTVPCGVSVDGTWQRRGHTSNNGCVSVISIDTGKVLDVEYLSSFCQTCKKKSNDNSSHVCTANYYGSAPNMEPVGAYRIFERSILSRGLAYVYYYGDGDSKSFNSVQNVYDNFSIEKLECIGHVQKRVGARLRKLKKNVKGLGGRNKLTDHFIDKLQNYYGIAIRSNVGNLNDMQQFTIAALFHCASSENKPMHGQCPAGKMSWCRYQKALVNPNVKFKHGPGLPQTVLNHVKPVYMDLCKKELLSKCLHGKTQNANESFNGMVWQRLPKTNFVRLDTLSFGVNDAVIVFNNGSKGLIDVFITLGLSVGEYTYKGLCDLDVLRIKKATKAATPCIKTQRKIIRASKKQKQDHHEHVEGQTYKSGEY